MGFFSNMYTKEGPGVPKNAPKKKGIARYFEIFMRDMGALWKANFLTLLCFVPSLLAVSVGVLFKEYLGIVLIAAIVYMLGSLLVGPALVALHAVVIKAIRDEPCYTWHEYKRAWKANAKQALPVGLIMMVSLALETFSVNFFFFGETSNLVMLALVFFGILLVLTCSTFVYMQILYIDLPLVKMLKNSILILFGCAKRSLPAGIISFIFFLAGTCVFSAILTVPLALLGIPVYIMLVIDMWAWPVMDTLFKITEQETERKEKIEKDALLDAQIQAETVREARRLEQQQKEAEEKSSSLIE